MRLLRFIIRILRLPFDLLFVTVDFLRLGVWLVIGLFWKSLGGEIPPFPPCVNASFEEVDGADVTICPLGRKYGNRFFLKLICGGGSEERYTDRGCLYLCTIEGAFRTGFWRLMLTGLVLFVLWGSILGAGLWGISLRYGHQLRAFFFRPPPPVQTVTSQLDDAQSRAKRARQWVLQGKKAMGQKDFASARMAFREATDLDEGSIPAFLGQGKSCLEMGLVGEALTAYNHAQALDGTSVKAYLGAAKACRALHYDRQALKDASTARDLAPNNYDAVLEMATCLRENGKLDEALKAAQQAVALSPKSPDAYVELGAGNLAQGNIDAAEESYRKAMELDPTTITAQVGLAEVLVARGSLQDAEHHFLRIVTEFPNNVEARTELAETELKLGHVDNALGVYKRLTEDFPKQYPLRARYGEILLEANRTDESYSVLHDLLKDDPGDVLGHLVMADLFLRRGFVSLAEQHVRDVLSQRPGDPQAYRLQVRILMARNQIDPAIRILEAMNSQMPKDLEVKLRLAYCYRVTGKDKKAEKVLLDAVDLFPTSPLPPRQLASLYEKEGRVSDADKLYRKALLRSPKDVVTINNYANFLVDLPNRKKEALEMAEKAYGIAPKNPLIADTLGWAMQRNGNSKRAAQLLNFAASQLPGNAQVQYHWGALEYARGSVDAARKSLQQALQSGQTFRGIDKARELLAKIQNSALGKQTAKVQNSDPGKQTKEP